MQKNNIHVYAAYVTLFIFSLLLPLNVYASPLFHTIQTSSFSSISAAQKQYDSIANTLDKTQLDNLRIEKIGKFYSVRLGKFMDYASAEKFIGTVKSHLSDATVMKAYIKKERIVKLYSGSATVSMKEPEERSSSAPVLDPVKSKATKHADKKAEGILLQENLNNIKALVKKNNYTAALDIITAEIAKQPEHPDLNAWFGMVLLKMDKPSQALEYLEKATELSPDITDFHNGLGYSYLYLDRFGEAIFEFNKAIRLDPGHFDAFTGLCIAYAKNDNKEKAMEIYHKIKFIDKKTSNQLLTIINK